MKNLCKLYIILFLFQSSSLSAQEKYYSLHIVQNDTSNSSIIKKKSYQKNFADTLILKKELQNILMAFYQEGYLTANFNSLIFDSTKVNACLFSGKQFIWGKLCFDDIDETVIRKVGLNTKHFNNNPVNYTKLFKVQDKILKYYENNGYPFASLKLENINIYNDGIQGDLKLTPNGLFTIDSIYIKGKAKISQIYLYKYLGIKPGDYYNEDKIKNIGNRLKELTFVKEIKPFEVEFSSRDEAFSSRDEARLVSTIYLYLDKKKSNQFNGILGVLPNNKTTGKLLLTGELNLLLQNSFSKGEIISFDWQKLEVSTQKLKIKLVYPYLFSSTIGIDLNFMLFQKDTSYLTVNTNLGLQFLMQGGDFVKIYIENKSSSLISTSGMENITSLPQYADINTTLYGIGYKVEHLDYKFNPRKGYAFLFNIGAGNKKIEKNPRLPADIYEGIELKTTQAEGLVNISYFQPVGENTVLMFCNKTGYINNSSLFENELFKIGGLKTLRGFDEESILASFFSVMTLEYRYLFEQNSNFYLFLDGAYYEKDMKDNYVSDFPFGFGVGINIETKAGIFTINYALGKQFDNPIEIRSAKIHFGYVNRF